MSRLQKTRQQLHVVTAAAAAGKNGPDDKQDFVCHRATAAGVTAAAVTTAVVTTAAVTAAAVVKAAAACGDSGGCRDKQIS